MFTVHISDMHYLHSVITKDKANHRWYSRSAVVPYVGGYRKQFETQDERIAQGHYCVSRFKWLLMIKVHRYERKMCQTLGRMTIARSYRIEGVPSYIDVCPQFPMGD